MRHYAGDTKLVKSLKWLEYEGFAHTVPTVEPEKTQEMNQEEHKGEKRKNRQVFFPGRAEVNRVLQPPRLLTL